MIKVNSQNKIEKPFKRSHEFPRVDLSNALVKESMAPQAGTALGLFVALSREIRLASRNSVDHSKSDFYLVANLRALRWSRRYLRLICFGVAFAETVGEVVVGCVKSEGLGALNDDSRIAANVPVAAQKSATWSAG